MKSQGTGASGVPVLENGNTSSVLGPARNPKSGDGKNHSVHTEKDAHEPDDLWKMVKDLVGEVSPLDDDSMAEIQAALDTGKVPNNKNGRTDEEAEGVSICVLQKDSSPEAMEIETELLLVDMPSLGKPLLDEDIVIVEQQETADPMEVDDDDYSFGDSSVEEEGSTDLKRIDLCRLASILERGRKATSSINPEADVIIVLGSTGVGKSTFVQTIAGHKIRHGWDESLNRSCYVVEGVGESGFEIGQGMTSKTEHVRSYFRESSSTFYVDSSGFGDTHGNEADIATSICTREIASRCRRIRFLVLINAYSFFLDRATELRRNLNLVANFVGHNFNTFKKSFTFLFTHCNKAFDSVPSKINEACMNPDEVLNTMRKEVIRLLKALKNECSDPSLRNLVKFLGASLEKGQPYCDVFDPFLSNMAGMATQIEPRTCEHHILQPADHVKCSLTSTSRMHLSHELKMREQGISGQLEKGILDEGLYDDVRAVFTLATHIDDDICREPAQLVLKKLNEASTNFKNGIYELVQKIIIDSKGDMFSIDDAVSTKDAIDKLAAMEGLVFESQARFNDASDPAQVEVQAKIDNIRNEVLQSLFNILEKQHTELKLQLSMVANYVFLLEERVSSQTEDVGQLDLCSVRTKLEKLRVCCNIFQNGTNNAYEKARASAKETFMSIVTKVLDTEIDGSLTGCPAALRLMALLTEAQSSGLLDHFMFGSALSSAGGDWLDEIFPKARKHALALLNNVEPAVRGSLAEAFQCCTTTSSGKNSSNVFSRRLQGVMGEVDTIHRIIESNSMHHFATAQPRRIALKTLMVEFLQRCNLCGHLIEAIDSQRGALLQPCFDNLSFVANSLPASMSCDGRLVAALGELHRCLAAQLREVSGRLQGLACQLESSGAVVESSSQRQCMEILRSCSWFDAVLADTSPNDMFIAEGLDEVRKKYVKYGDDLVNKMTAAIENLSHSSNSTREVQNNVEFITSSIPSLRVVSSVVNSSHCDKFLDVFRERIRRLCFERRSQLCFPQSIGEVCFDEIDQALLLTTGLMGVDAKADLHIAGLYSIIEERLTVYSKSIGTAVEMDAEFEMKGSLLDAALKWSKYPSLLKHLPSSELLCQCVRNAVVERAEELHKKLNDAEDIKLNHVEQEVVYFLEAAKYVDSHIDGEASRWADAILRIFENRQEEVDGQILIFLDENNFDGIVGHLAPLKHAKEDSRKQKRYHKCMQALSTHLWRGVEEIRSIVKAPRVSGRHSTNEIRSKLQCLEMAESALQEFGKTLPPPANGRVPWSLGEENRITEQSMEKTKSQMIETASRAIERVDFCTALENNRHATMLQDVMKQSSWPLQRRRQGKSLSVVRAKILSLFSRVDESVEQFLSRATKHETESRAHYTSSFSLGHGQMPYTFLHNALDSLKLAVEQCVWSVEALECYNGAKQKLSRGLNDLHNGLRSEAREGKFSRSLNILGFLSKELGRGLGEHIELSFDIAEAITDITRQKQQQRRSLKTGLKDKESVNKLARHLDHLSTSRWYSNDYHDQRRALSEFVRDIVRETHGMIKNFEVGGLRRRFATIARIQGRLQRHLLSPENISQDVEKSLSERCSSFYRDMKTSFLNGNFDHFQVLFTTFQGLLAEIPPDALRGDHSHCASNLLAGFDKICCAMQTNVHQTLLQQTRGKLALFDAHVDTHNYELAASEAEKLRDLGYFLGSAFELYRREICSGVEDGVLRELNVIALKRFGSSRFLDIGVHITTLHLSPAATHSEVRRAYKDLSLQWHPDKRPGYARAQQKFVAIKAAHDSLSDDSTLAFYREYDFPFLVDALACVPRRILGSAKNAVSCQDYKTVDRLCGALSHISLLTSVARDPGRAKSVDIEKIRVNLYNTVRKPADALVIDIQNAWIKQDFVELHHSFVALESLENAFKARKEVVPESYTSKVLTELTSKLKDLETDFTDLRGKDALAANRAMTKFGLDLIRIGRILDGFPRLKMETKRIMFSILNGCRDEPWGVSFIFKLGLCLENGELSDDEDDARVGRVIVNSFPHFEDVRVVAFSREVITAPVQESVKKIKTEQFTGSPEMGAVPIDRRALKVAHDTYEKQFMSYFRKYVQKGHDELVQIIYTIIAELGSCSVSDWNSCIKAKVTEIVAGVFAIFSIIKSGDSFKRFEEHGGGGDDSNISNPMDLVFRPHNIQVLAVLRLLGIGDSGSFLRNHIMEIRTGEGKSLILGALSVVLALLGFSVRCVCYSEHLSERDNDLFKDIFVALGVENRITYSKINTMSEDSVASRGDIREMTLNLIRGPDSARTGGKQASTPVTSLAVHPRQPTSKTVVERAPSGGSSSHGVAGCLPLDLNGSEILLVDEVDVFFGPDFYGQTYNQIAELEDMSIEKLLRRIWKCRNKKLSFAVVKRWSEYTAVASKFADWIFLVDTEVRCMCNDVENFSDPPYEVDTMNSRIGYSKADSVDWNLVYGYRTAFAYLREFEKGRLKGPKAEAALQQALCLRVSVGQFSYARISPARILGVSGTLQALTVAEKQIVREFGVDMYSFVPSVYGLNNLAFDKFGSGIVVETEKSRQLQAIATEIHRAIKEDRAAIVFFENEEMMLEFKKSPLWREFRHGNILSSTTDKETRNYVIKKAATSGQVTIAPAAFGRGTDFFCEDSKLEGAGGMLVIQAFLSVEKSEEVQIKGRTARQGKQGSYMLVLLESDLCELLNIKPGECASKSRAELYNWLDGKRSVVHKQRLTETNTVVEEADKRDGMSRAYLDALVRRDTRGAKSHLEEIYRGISNKNRKLKFCRMVCISDATSSMSSIWSSTRDCIKEMLKRIEDIGEGQFELLWVAFRDYSDGAKLLEKSCWTKNPAELEAFVSKIKCSGGGDYPEAVEMALREVNNEHQDEPVTRALLIGDAPPHFESCGEILAAHNNHVMTTDYEKEAQQLKRNEIPVYTFTLNNDSDLVSSFKTIASISGGESHALDFDGSDGAQKLIDCVCETAIEDIGGSELLAEYKAQFHGS